MTENNELVIDETNFDQYFKDVRTNAPEPNQVMAVYSAVAELVDGNLKRDLIYLLSHTSKYSESVTLLRKIGWAEQGDAIRICREIVEDLVNGTSSEEVLAKSYSYKLEAFYYVNREYIPKNDPHWSFVEIVNLADKTEKVEHVPGGEIRSKIIFEGEKSSREDKPID
jgi:hypothetical protein